MNPLRAVELRLADLLDRLLGRSHSLVPPRRLNFVGPGDFVETGDEFLRYFKELGRLDPNDDVLDIGCGIGRMARPLTAYLDPRGSYTGFDIVAKGVEWCRARYEPRFKNFRFEVVDVANSKYNAKAAGSASEFTFPYSDGSFDFVFATSVFTHLQEEEARRYLCEAARVLRPGGRLFATFFLLNEESRELIKAGKSKLPFMSADGTVATISRDLPEEAVAFDEQWLGRELSAAGLTKETVAYGGWVERSRSTSLQDIVIASHP